MKVRSYVYEFLGTQTKMHISILNDKSTQVLPEMFFFNDSTKTTVLEGTIYVDTFQKSYKNIIIIIII